MKALEPISDHDAKKIGQRLGVDFNFFTFEEFKDAFNTELNAEIKEGNLQPNTELDNTELEAIARVAISHINVFDD